MLKIWAKRHRDLSRTRNQVACWLHAALCELVPGGVSKEIYAAHAPQILEETEPCGAVAQARAELAAELVADLRRVDAVPPIVRSGVLAGRPVVCRAFLAMAWFVLWTVTRLLAVIEGLVAAIPVR